MNNQDDKPKIWENNFYAGLLCDHYIINTELENGHILTSIQIINFLLSKLIKDNNHKLLLYSQVEKHNLLSIIQNFQTNTEFYVNNIQKIKDEKTFNTDFLAPFLNLIKNMNIDTYIFVPGGYIGITSTVSLMHIIYKVSPSKYHFITCNTGDGLQYHPSKPFYKKKKKKNNMYSNIVYQRSICIETTHDKIINPIFWNIYYAMWLRQPSCEYNRIEVIYDVLLPWLDINNTELLPNIITNDLKKTDEEGKKYIYGHQQCSQTSNIGSIIESLSYLLNIHYNIGKNKILQFEFYLKYQALNHAYYELQELSEKNILSSTDIKILNLSIESFLVYTIDIYGECEEKKKKKIKKLLLH